MPLFAATYTYSPDLAERREENKPDHRRWLAEQVDAGHILSVGPFPDGGGALLIVSADSADQAEDLLSCDPHRLRGLVAETTVRRWLPVFGAFS